MFDTERDEKRIAENDRHEEARIRCTQSINRLENEAGNAEYGNGNLSKKTAFDEYRHCVGLFSSGSLSEFPDVVNDYKTKWKNQTGINFPITSWFLFQMCEHGKPLLYTAAVLSASIGFGLFFTATAGLSVPAMLLLGMLATTLSMSAVKIGTKAKEYTPPMQYCH